jgi:GTP cyclohydrolase IA
MREVQSALVMNHPPDPAPEPGLRPLRPFDAVAFEAAVEQLLSACGVDVDSQPHMAHTAARVRELWSNRLLSGYHSDPATVLGTGFADPRTDWVLLRGIAVHGVCPHHLVPFRGIAHVAYLPGGRLHGFGRIARLVDVVANRFTYQEWLTRDVAEALVQHGAAQAAVCRVECAQLCLLLGEDRRGDERVITESFAGDASHRSEALALVRS